MNSVLLIIFPALMAFAACSDLLTMKISNRLVLATLAFFPVLALVAGMSLPQFGMHIGAAFLVLAVTFAFFAAGWIGGGDAKFAAGTALWLGFDLLLPYLIYAGLFGGVLTLAMLGARRIPLPARLGEITWIGRLHNASTGIPYGIALAGAAMVVYADTFVFARLSS